MTGRGGLCNADSRARDVPFGTLLKTWPCCCGFGFGPPHVPNLGLERLSVSQLKGPPVADARGKFAQFCRLAPRKQLVFEDPLEETVGVVAVAVPWGVQQHPLDSILVKRVP